MLNRGAVGPLDKPPACYWPIISSEAATGVRPGKRSPTKLAGNGRRTVGDSPSVIRVMDPNPPAAASCGHMIGIPVPVDPVIDVNVPVNIDYYPMVMPVTAPPGIAPGNADRHP